MDEAEIKKILEAAGKSASAENKKNIKDLTDELKKANLSPTQIRNINTELKKAALQANLSAAQLKKFNEAVDNGTNKQLDLLDATEKLEKGFYQSYRASGLSSAAATKAAEQHLKATEFVKQFGAAAVKGSGKIDDLTAAFKGRFGGLGDAVVSVGSALQANIDVFRTLSNVGAAFGQNLVTLRETAAAAGLPIEDFTKFIQNNAPALAAFYGSASEGAVAFSRLSRQFRTLNLEQLAPLGLTVEDFNDALLAQLNISRLTGSIDLRDTRAQSMAATSLVLEMDKMAKLTGQSRKQLMKDAQDQMRRANFMAFMNKQTPEAQTQILAFTAAIKKIAPELEDGILDTLAAGGNATTDAAVALMQNMNGVGNVTTLLTNRSIDAGQAIQMLKKEAILSGESFRDITQYGNVPFLMSMQNGVNELAKFEGKIKTVSAEQEKRDKGLTTSLTQFENNAKALSASFQSIETGFFAYLGGALGKGVDGVNVGVSKLATAIDMLSPATKALLYVGTKLSNFILDKATQVGVVYMGTFMALQKANMAGGASMFGGMGKAAGKAGMSAISSPMGKLGVGGLVAGVGANLAGPETETGKALGVLSGAMTGAAVGSMFGPIGTAVGAVAGGLLSMANQPAYSGPTYPVSRATGTLGELGLPFEPKTSMLKVHAGERVLNPSETQEYNNDKPDAALAQRNLEFKQFSQTTKQLLEAQKMTNELLNKQVAIQVETEKNTKKTSKVVDKVGASII